MRATRQRPYPIYRIGNSTPWCLPHGASITFASLYLLNLRPSPLLPTFRERLRWPEPFGLSLINLEFHIPSMSRKLSSAPIKVDDKIGRDFGRRFI